MLLDKESKQRHFLSVSIFLTIITLIYFLQGSILNISPASIQNITNEMPIPKMDSTLPHKNNSKNNPPTDIKSKDSIEQKRSVEIENSKLAVNKIGVLSSANMYKLLLKKGVMIDPEMASRMKNDTMTDKDFEIIQIIIAQQLSEEENFRIEMMQYRNFQKIQSEYEKRASKTGLFYGDEILSQPGIYYDATFEDISAILKSGARLPNDFLISAIYSKNIDLAIKLKDAGYNINIDYYDQFQSANTLELLVKNYSLMPSSDSIDKNFEDIEKLQQLGVPLKINDGSQDALDIALNAAVNYNDPKSADLLLILAQKINADGISMEKSHYQLLDQLKNKYPELYERYAKNFN